MARLGKMGREGGVLRETASAGGRTHANIPKRTGVGRRNELRSRQHTETDLKLCQAETKVSGPSLI